VPVAYGATIGAIDSIALMHLDTLGGLKELRICRAYEIDGTALTFFPANIARLAQASAVYETLPGWDEDISAVTTFEDLPVNAQDYVRRVEQLIGKPITIVGVGPKRSQTIFRQ